MKPEEAVKTLSENGLLNAKQERLLSAYYSHRFIPLNYEIRGLFWLGTILFISGIGMWIREGITPGIVILAMSAGCIGCFGYAQVKKNPFSRNDIKSPGVIHDGILLLACLLLLTLVGYLEYQYSMFRQRWDILALASTMLFFFLAYYHDHRGVLLLALKGLTLWIGIKVTPEAVFLSDLIKKPELIDICIVYSVLFIVLTILFNRLDFKSHFTVLYIHFYINLMFSSMLTGFFNYELSLYYLLMVCASSFVMIMAAIRLRSVMLLLYPIVYSYICVSAKLIDWFGNIKNWDDELIFLYFFVSALAIASILFRKRSLFHKRFK